MKKRFVFFLVVCCCCRANYILMQFQHPNLFLVSVNFFFLDWVLCGFWRRIEGSVLHCACIDTFCASIRTHPCQLGSRCVSGAMTFPHTPLSSHIRLSPLIIAFSVHCLFSRSVCIKGHRINNTAKKMKKSLKNMFSMMRILWWNIVY